jgi:selenocysteine lyase/cysteine desulfurase
MLSIVGQSCRAHVANCCCRREEARSIIQRGVNAGAEHAVLFTGSGATGASCKLCALMQLLPQWRPLPVVIVSSLEHHSNILPWRESGAVVLTVGQSHSAPFVAVLDCRSHSPSFPFLSLCSSIA